MKKRLFERIGGNSFKLAEETSVGKYSKETPFTPENSDENSKWESYYELLRSAHYGIIEPQKLASQLKSLGVSPLLIKQHVAMAQTAKYNGLTKDQYEKLSDYRNRMMADEPLTKAEYAEYDELDALFSKPRKPFMAGEEEDDDL